MIRKIIKSLPGIRSVVADRNRIAAELNTWRAGQTYPPGHFYSPIPDKTEVRGISLRSGDRSRQTIPGVDLQWENQEDLFRQLARFYGDIPFGETELTRTSHRYYFENGFYSYTDGILLYALLRHLKPRRMIEVGSGFSSCLTLDVNELFLENQLKCTFIEPYPDRLKKNLRPGDQERIAIIEDKVQNTGVELFAELLANDILFIDSSHVGKAGSDVNFLLFEVLPRLNPGVWVHVHDVFYPFEYPEEWIMAGRSWNEAYMVRCLLMQNSAFAIRLWGDALCAQRQAMVESLMPACLKNTGAGIWLQRTDHGA